ncbi:MAG TPA: DivIVA domain-containing protein [Capillimicrobium sp.]
MPLDRQAIEKRDFPIGRRGYDPAAVDAHLARLADEMEALGRQVQRRSGESLAQAASEQVRAIVQAAESSAAEIERSAEEEAQQIRSDASRDAERTRVDAVERAQGHVGRVSSATGEMLARVEAMQRELGTLVETLRTGAHRVNADLSLLESNMGELYQAAGAGGGAAELRAADDDVTARGPEVAAYDNRPAPAAPPTPAAPPAPEPVPSVPPVPQPSGGAADASSAVEREPEPEAESGDVEGARLIALNMALNGQPRDETDRYLAENFELSDRRRLLDEVYASIETG